MKTSRKEKPEITEANIYCALTAQQYAKFFTYSISFSPPIALGLFFKKTSWMVVISWNGEAVRREDLEEEWEFSFEMEVGDIF